MKLRQVFMLFLVFAILAGGTGISAAPAQAASCRAWHTVRWGESLSWIGRWYGVSWPWIAQANGIGSPYRIYAGQVLCIPSGYHYTTYPTYYSGAGGRLWSFVVTDVVKDTSVTIRTHNFPSNVLFKVRIGRALSGGGYDWRNLPDLDSGSGGSFSATIALPAEFAGAHKLVLRLIQNKKNGKSFTQDQAFINATYSAGTGGGGYWQPTSYGYWYGYWGIPTIWIVSVVRNASVTIRTHNFPPNTNFDVLMGPMGTRGINGYYVSTFNSGAGGSQLYTFSIPPQLYGSYQIAIRTQNYPSGYYSYNWFYNNTAYAP